MNELALFAGAGGGILGGKLLGWDTVCAVEIDPYCRRVLLARQRDGMLKPFPIWDDVRTFDGKPWRWSVDIISGGFPCQDISAAGKGAGINGEKSGLWKEFARIICEVQPRYVFVENSPMLAARGLGRVLGDLATMGFDAKWGVLGADDAGAPHIRQRIWIVATNSDGSRVREQSGRIEPWRAGPVFAGDHGAQGDVADTNDGVDRRWQQFTEGGKGARDVADMGNPDGVRQLQQKGTEPNERRRSSNPGWWTTEPDVGRMAHGVASRVDRLKAIGNGQVPAVARLAWEMLKVRE